MFRQFIRLRKVLQGNGTEIDATEAAVLVNNGLNTVDEFESTYGQFCESCISEFNKLSRVAKISSGMYSRQRPCALLILSSILYTVLDLWGSLSC
jgi:hypothetical protein